MSVKLLDTKLLDINERNKEGNAIFLFVQVIIEMGALWLVEDCVISYYNLYARGFARGDYNTEALIFKMDTARFLGVFEEETNKMKENAISLIITWAIILRQWFSSGSVNIVQ